MININVATACDFLLAVMNVIYFQEVSFYILGKSLLISIKINYHLLLKYNEL